MAGKICTNGVRSIHAEASRDDLFSYTPPFPVNPENSVVFFDIAAEEEELGRVEIELFDDCSPALAINFKALCHGYMYGRAIASKQLGKQRSGRQRKFLRYEGTIFHNVQPGYICVGGDNEFFDGTGGESYCGDQLMDCFRDKGGKIPGPGCVCMVTHTRKAVRSQFMFTYRALPHVERRNSTVGQIISGWDVIEKMQGMATASGKTRKEISVCEKKGRGDGVYFF